MLINRHVGNGTQARQNAAHRADTTWPKTDRHTYTRADGVTITKDLAQNWWYVYLPDGSHAANEYGHRTGAHSLTFAKYAAANITADGPAYQSTR